MAPTKRAYEIEIDDFIAVYGRTGFYRVVVGPHRDVFSECYYYTNVILSDGSKISFKLDDEVPYLKY